MSVSIRSAFAMSVGAAICALAFQGPVQAEPVKLRYASSAPPKTVWAMQTERLAKDITSSARGPCR